MTATYGFRATMTARPGKGDELIEVLLSATTDGSGPSENCVVFLVGRSASNSDVIYVTEGWTTKDAHAENSTRHLLKPMSVRMRQVFGFRSCLSRGRNAAADLVTKVRRAASELFHSAV